MTTVVVTGGTQGIGRGLAESFARRGAGVVIAGRDAERVEQALVAMAGLPGEVAGLTCDVARADDVQALWDLACGRFGQVDIWVNNAGVARTTWPILEVPQTELETMVTTNMLGTINGCRIAARGMQRQGFGKIFNMLGGGSDGEYFPGFGIYGSTKRGLDYFTRALEKELAHTPIIVGRIRPGLVITEAVVREARADMEAFQRSRKMLNRLVDPVETVAPFLTERMLAADRSGIKIRWLSGGRMAARIFGSAFRQRPDQFERFGL